MCIVYMRWEKQNLSDVLTSEVLFGLMLLFFFVESLELDEKYENFIFYLTEVNDIIGI